jgi:hypothetical protein
MEINKVGVQLKNSSYIGSVMENSTWISRIEDIKASRGRRRAHPMPPSSSPDDHRRCKLVATVACGCPTSFSLPLFSPLWSLESSQPYHDSPLVEVDAGHRSLDPYLPCSNLHAGLAVGAPCHVTLLGFWGRRHVTDSWFRRSMAAPRVAGAAVM